MCNLLELSNECKKILFEIRCKSALNLPAHCISESFIKIKINLNFYVHFFVVP